MANLSPRFLLIQRCASRSAQPQKEGDLREFLLFPRPPIQPADSRSPITIRVRDSILEGMKLGHQDTDDMMTRAIRACDEIKSVELVCFLPYEYKDTDLVAAPDSPPGERMTQNEMKRFVAPAGFVAFGWKGQNIPPNAMFGCLLLRKRSGRGVVSS